MSFFFVAFPSGIRLTALKREWKGVGTMLCALFQQKHLILLRGLFIMRQLDNPAHLFLNLLER